MTDGDFIDEEAEQIDSMIIFYVDDRITTDEEAETYVKNYLE